MNPAPTSLSARWLALAAGLTLLGGTAAAQPPAEPPAAPARLSEVQSITLRFASAAEAAGLIEKLLDKRPQTVHIVADPARNAILVSGGAADLARVREIISKIDVAGAENEAPRSRLAIYALKSAEPDQAFEAALRLAVPPNGPGNFAVDRQRKLVIVNADDLTQRTIEALLSRLDEPRAVRPEVNVQVRVVWLVNGPARDGNPAPPPDDLKEVLPALAKLGIDRPRLAAQALVNVTPNSQFQAKGMAELDGPCQFSATGRFNVRGASSGGLDVAIRATRPGRNGTEELCNIQTEISAPPGHLVVLGLTPTGSSTSAFVVQVLPAPVK
jgi:hypothetical protein